MTRLPISTPSDPPVPWTADRVRDLIRSQMESTIPDDVLAVLKRFDGKLITTRLEKALNSEPAILAGGPWRLIRHYGWSCIQNEAYGTRTDAPGFDIMLARSEASVPLDCAWVESNSGCYYEARRRRNATRVLAINRPYLMDQIAMLAEQSSTALFNLRSAHDAFVRHLDETEAGSALLSAAGWDLVEFKDPPKARR